MTETRTMRVATRIIGAPSRRNTATPCQSWYPASSTWPSGPLVLAAGPDPLDLRFARGIQPFARAPVLLLHCGARIRIKDAGKCRRMHHVRLGELGGVQAADLGDRRLLLVGQRTLLDIVLDVLLTQT